MMIGSSSNSYLRLLLRDLIRHKDFMLRKDSAEHGLCAQSRRNLRIGANRHTGG